MATIGFLFTQSKHFIYSITNSRLGFFVNILRSSKTFSSGAGNLERNDDEDTAVRGVPQGHQNDAQLLLYLVVQELDKRLIFKVSCQKKSPLSSKNQHAMGRKLSKNSENASILVENSQKLSQKLKGRNFKWNKQVSVISIGIKHQNPEFSIF